MKISAEGAGVGALVGSMARAGVVLINMGPASDHFAAIALPSAGIGLLVGAIAGALGRPLLGAGIGAILSGVVFELFMCACASLIGSFSQKASNDFLSQTLIYGLEMAAAGALAGGLGGLVGWATDTDRQLSSAASRLNEGDKNREILREAEKLPSPEVNVPEGLQKEHRED